MTNRDERWQENRQLLIDAADRAGIDRGVMAKIAGFESDFNQGARPISTSRPWMNTVRQFDGVMAASSAYGYGQFIDGTWLDTVRRYGEQYGIENASQMTKAQANAPEIRSNAALQAGMLAELTRENLEKGRRLGGPDPDANVYAFHNLGDGDATRFLQALRTDPNQRADAVLSRAVIAGNPSLYGDGSRTIGESYDTMGGNLRRYERFARDAILAPGPQERPEPQAIAQGTSVNAAPDRDLDPASRGILPPVLRPQTTTLVGGMPDYLLPGREVAPPAPSQQAPWRPGPPLAPGRAASLSQQPDEPGKLSQLSTAVDLQHGDRGTAVLALQQHLRLIGATDRDGQELKPDRDYGDRTKEAVEQFQLWTGRPVTGIADQGTLEALQAQSRFVTRQHEQGDAPGRHLADNLQPAAPNADLAADPRPVQGRETVQTASTSSITSQPGRSEKAPVPSQQTASALTSASPGHPDRELLENLQGQVRRLDKQAGKGWDENSERLAASALVVARKMGFTAHDDLRLTFNDASQRHGAGELLFVSRQGTTASPDPAANLTYMPTAEALSKPARNRYQEVESINQTQVEALRMAQQQAVGLDDPARSGPVR